MKTVDVHNFHRIFLKEHGNNLFQRKSRILTCLSNNYTLVHINVYFRNIYYVTLIQRAITQ